MKLNTLYEKYKDRLSANQRWHVENALFCDVAPDYVFEYFNAFKFEEVEITKTVAVPPIYSTNPKVISVETEKILLLKQRAALHAQLSVVQTDEQRYEIAKELIEEVQPNLEKIYAKLDLFKKTGSDEILTNTENERAIIEKTKTYLRRQNTIDKLISQRQQKYEQEKNDRYLLEIEQFRKELAIIKAFLYA